MNYDEALFISERSSRNKMRKLGINETVFIKREEIARIGAKILGIEIEIIPIGCGEKVPDENGLTNQSCFVRRIK